MITLYTKPQCQQCDATKKYLERLELRYVTHDVTEDDKAYNFVKGMGYQSLPVVVAGFDHWSGFRPDLLRKLKNEPETEQSEGQRRSEEGAV